LTLRQRVSFGWKIRQSDGKLSQKSFGNRGRSYWIKFPRKASWRETTKSVPKTDTGGLDEKSKANGRREFKELGKKSGRNIWRCPTLLIKVTAKECLPTV